MKNSRVPLRLWIFFEPRQDYFVRFLAVPSKLTHSDQGSDVVHRDSGQALDLLPHRNYFLQPDHVVTFRTKRTEDCLVTSCVSNLQREQGVRLSPIMWHSSRNLSFPT